MKQSIFLLFLPTVFTTLLSYCHGLGPSTVVKTDRGFSDIKQISLQAKKNQHSVWSYNVQTHCSAYKKVVSAGHSISNCYVRICFDDCRLNDILCTPTQEFYVPTHQRWVPACHLRTDYHLLSDGYKPITITFVELIEKPLEVYALEIDDWHTFLVGRHAIVTHNMIYAVASFWQPISWSLGTGVAIGMISPPVAIGVIVGGAMITMVMSGIIDKQIRHYRLSFDTSQIKNNLKTKQTEEIDDDAQAPGKPKETDGYIPPKNWDGKKVKNPNGPGYGWPDKKGRVWVPSGPKGHGGPHWDVEYPSKGKIYDNVYPGGKVRSSKK